MREGGREGVRERGREGERERVDKINLLYVATSLEPR